MLDSLVLRIRTISLNYLDLLSLPPPSPPRRPRHATHQPIFHSEIARIVALHSESFSATLRLKLWDQALYQSTARPPGRCEMRRHPAFHLQIEGVFCRDQGWLGGFFLGGDGYIRSSDSNEMR